MLLLSAKAGLRAAEIAGLTWAMLIDADGRLTDHIALSNHIAKKGSGRSIPIHPRLRAALMPLQREAKSQGYVQAARVLGYGDLRIMITQLLPNMVGPIIVIGTLGMGGAVLAEASLSFLGLGIRPPAISWGVLLQEAQNIQTLALAPWLLIPGLVVIVSVLAFNLVGDGLRDAADPYSN